MSVVLILFFVLLFFFNFYAMHKKESIQIEKKFKFQFLMVLYVSGCPVYNLTIFRKCLSVSDTNFVAVLAETNLQIFMKFYV